MSGQVRVIGPVARQELAARATERVAAGTARLWWLGGATFVVRTPEAVLWIDPFFGPPARPQFHRQRPPLLEPEEIGAVDAVLITHEHNDHCHLPTLSAMASRNPGFPVFAPSVSERKIAGELPQLRAITAGRGYQGRLADVGLRVLEGNDPMAEEGVMLLLGTPAGKLFFAGDSLYTEGFFEGLKSERIDVACFSVGDLLFGQKAYMTPTEFGRAAQETGARAAVPVHWDLWEEAKVDPETVSDWGTPALRLLQPGQGLELS